MAGVHAEGHAPAAGSNQLQTNVGTVVFVTKPYRSLQLLTDTSSLFVAGSNFTLEGSYAGDVTRV